MRIDNFKPYGSQRVTVAGASAATKLTPGTTVRIVNLGASIIYAKFGDASVVATNADVAIPVNGVAVMEVSAGDIGGGAPPSQPTYVALIGDGASTANVATGEGS